MEKRVRSRYFVLSGGLGGLVGLALLEAVAVHSQGAASPQDKIGWMALYFGGFGLAVGAALGMTEGIVRKNRGRVVYGLAMGLLLGAVGGGVGGALGQAIYGLVPLRYASQSKVDLAAGAGFGAGWGGGPAGVGAGFDGEATGAGNATNPFFGSTASSVVVGLPEASTIFSWAREIGQHFGVPSTAVKRAGDQHAGR